MLLNKITDKKLNFIEFNQNLKKHTFNEGKY